MTMPATSPPDTEALKRLMLDIASKLSVPVVLNTIVERLAAQPHVALARIWLQMPGDICPTCRHQVTCQNSSTCLHLSASFGYSVADRQEEWIKPELSPFFRLPMGHLRVGRIAQTKQPLDIPDISLAEALPQDSFAIEKIIGFSGQPMLYRGDMVGVLSVFTRVRPNPEMFTWLRLIADQAAIAVANARAFHEIEELKAQLEQENAYLHEELNEVHEAGEIVGQSPAIFNILRQIELVAPTEASVLILGESGTGKELVAREIHKRSARHDRPMVKVNCASIPRDLYESEFFGHAKGAFTGALNDRGGRFALADGGTLFLDEIGEIPLDLQPKLLRVLQEGYYERVGEEITRQVDVRIIAATNRNLKKEVDRGRFRQDLYYRLNVFPIEVSPLRERKEDIPVLAAHFLEHEALSANRPGLRLTKGNLQALTAYDWPGNVRELQNVIERAVILSRSGHLEFDLLGESQGGRFHGPATTNPKPNQQRPVLTERQMRELERKNIANALARCGGKIYGAGGAAELLGLKPTTLSSRIKKLGLDRPPERPGDFA